VSSVLYTCPFVPAEWILAHGLSPQRFLPSPSRDGDVFAGVGEGICPFARAAVETACTEPGAAALVATTTCDQMRRAAEFAEAYGRLPVFLMHVPSSWESAGAHRYYRGELKRLGRFLEEVGGRVPSSEDLAAAMEDLDAARGALLDARPGMTSSQFAGAVAEFHRGGVLPAGLPAKGNEVGSGVPLALVGSPFFEGHLEVFDLIERLGGRVALDATTSGEGSWPRPFSRRRLREDPFDELADAYFGSIPDAFRRPNSLLYQWLKRELQTRGIRGIIFRRYVWCDTWHAEAQRMKEWCGMPMLILEPEDDARLRARGISRIEAFMEVLR
jgi:benzoyl-CoA reductase/2-hydroxyglutaryl-CoA dehydratase subunit BcrC/BadD/HgdB